MRENDDPPPIGSPGETPSAPPAIPGHQLLRRIASGAYGEVWLARNHFSEHRAVKIVRRDSFDNPRPYDRELAGLQRYEPVSREHEGLVDVLQVGCDEAGGFFYYVMELADAAHPQEEHGGSKIEEGKQPPAAPCHPPSSIFDPLSYSSKTLAHEIRRRGRLPVSEAIEIGIALTRALEFLHARRLIHRDIKPANIIFVGGQPKLADVGLVAHLDATFTRGDMGTTGYIAPEGANTEQADLYSLGKVLYEAATGKAHYEFPDLPTNLGEETNNAELSEINEVLLNACENNPRNRFRSAATMRESLEYLRAGRSLRTRRKRRHVMRWSAGLITCFLLAGAGMWGARLYYLEGGLKRIESFNSPLVSDWINIIPARVDSRNGQELLVPQGKSLRAFRSDGGLVSEWMCPEADDKGLALQFLADTDSDGRDETFVSWNNGANCFVSEIKGSFWERPGRFFAVGHAPVSTNAAHTSLLVARAFIRAEECHDKRSKLIASLETYYGGAPRAVCCFDYQTRTQTWQRTVAPVPGNFAMVDLDGDGQSEILFGSSATDNGTALPDGTDDSHSYIFAFSLNGEPLWRRELGGLYSQTTVLTVDSNSSARPRLFAWLAGGITANGRTVPVEGDIVELDTSGKILRALTNDSRITSLIAMPALSNAPVEFLFSDSNGNLYLLDGQLNSRAKKQIASLQLRHDSFDYVDLKLIHSGVLAFGLPMETVLGCRLVRKHTPTNFGNPDDRPNSEWYEKVEIMVLGQDLNPVARRTVANNIATPFNWKLITADVDGDGYPEIISATDRVTVLKRTYL